LFVTEYEKYIFHAMMKERGNISLLKNNFKMICLSRKQMRCNLQLGVKIKAVVAIDLRSFYGKKTAYIWSNPSIA